MLNNIIKLYFSPDRCSLGSLELQIQHSAGLAGTMIVGRDHTAPLPPLLAWWPDDLSHGIYFSPIHP